jgi:hypothetical protein
MAVARSTPGTMSDRRADSQKTPNRATSDRDPSLSDARDSGLVAAAATRPRADRIVPGPGFPACCLGWKQISSRFRPKSAGCNPCPPRGTADFLPAHRGFAHRGVGSRFSILGNAISPVPPTPEKRLPTPSQSPNGGHKVPRPPGIFFLGSRYCGSVILIRNAVTSLVATINRRTCYPAFINSAARDSSGERAAKCAKFSSSYTAASTDSRTVSSLPAEPNF